MDEDDDRPNQSRTKWSVNLAAILGTTVGFASLLVFLAVCGLWYRTRNKDPGLAAPVVPQYKAYTAEEMRVATDNFDASNIIGSGATSVCYRGAMKSPQGMMRVVALKKLTMEYEWYGDKMGDDEARKSFSNECKTLCKLRHSNLVKVLGYCVEGQANLALAMEYMEGGDLDKRLHMHHDAATS